MKGNIEGQIVDILHKKIFPGRIEWNEEGVITDIQILERAPDYYIMPGFIDAHIHIESTMLHPQHFAKVARRQGTIATLSDPHEIANVLGVAGVAYMVEHSKNLPVDIHYGAPSCVPAAPGLENNGATLGVNEISYLFKDMHLGYLAEVMNYPGVLDREEEVMGKIKVAQDLNKPIDGHAPLLSGEDLQKYVDAGISTDHECSTLEEAIEKIQTGMHIMIREGSAAKNYEALKTLIDLYPDQVMLCSDDAHADELLLGHINKYVKRAITDGLDLWNVLKVACWNPKQHFNLPHGFLRINDAADFIVVKDLSSFDVLGFYRKGKEIKEEDIPSLKLEIKNCPNHFELPEMKWNDFIQFFPDLNKQRAGQWNIIQVIDQQILTTKKTLEFKGSIQELLDLHSEFSLLCVINRYQKELRLQVAIVENFGNFQGALGSSVMHDCHNLILVGKELLSLYQTLTELIRHKGGVVAWASSHEISTLPLPIAGLMSNKTAEVVAKQLEDLNKTFKQMNLQLTAPLMTLSFLALPVIPRLKLTDVGLFDTELQTFIDSFPKE